MDLIKEIERYNFVFILRNNIPIFYIKEKLLCDNFISSYGTEIYNSFTYDKNKFDKETLDDYNNEIIQPINEYCNYFYLIYFKEDENNRNLYCLRRNVYHKDFNKEYINYMNKKIFQYKLKELTK